MHTESTLIVFLKEEQVFGKVVQMLSHVSRVQYEKDGIEWDTWVENDEFIPYESIGLRYE